MTTIDPCVILHNRVFERFEVYDYTGLSRWASANEKLFDFFDAVMVSRNMNFQEVPLNSREGQRITARIGQGYFEPD